VENGMKVNLVMILALGAALSCAAQTAPQASQKPIELQHIDVTNIDRSVDPCVNFYQYVCGRLNAANPIPADQIDWGPGEQLEMWNRQVLRQILEKNQAASPTRTANEQKIGDYYASCMSQASSNADSVAAIRPLLERIASMKDKHEIATVLAALHSAYGQAWEGGDNQTDAAMLGFGPTPDYNDATSMAAGVDQGGLGMPSRDYYLGDDAATNAIREKYTNLIVTLLKMDGAGAEEAGRDAASILRLETAMAKAQMDNVSRRDPNKLNNRYTLAQLKELTPAFDWQSYLDGIGAPAVSVYLVTSPEFFRTLNGLLASEDLDTWKVYLRWQLLLAAAPSLGNNWRTARFTLASALWGLKEQPPDWRRCGTSVDNQLGEALGQVYVAQAFPPESKARVLTMVKQIEAAMGRDLDEVTWMQPATKRVAHEKLAAVMEKIGYPDKWIDYSTLTIRRESYPANVERATAFELKRQLGLIGKPVDRSLWMMTPPTVNAYEDPQMNTINFPAGILQPPFFDPGADDVINYGAEGAVMGHELTHDFDDQGRKFDTQGNLRDWWTAADEKEYDQRGECIAKEYTGPVPGVSGVEQNGKLTQGEDTADNGGIHLALSALTRDLLNQGKTLEDRDKNGLTNLQRFFISYGVSWCDQIRPEALRTLIQTNPHSMPELRVNNVLANMPEFQQAFHCREGQPMVHVTRCRVW
jgi:endothelin-converting enzyme/putative endopeptidase